MLLFELLFELFLLLLLLLLLLFYCSIIQHIRCYAELFEVFHFYKFIQFGPLFPLRPVREPLPRPGDGRPRALLGQRALVQPAGVPGGGGGQRQRVVGSGFGELFEGNLFSAFVCSLQNVYSKILISGDAHISYK